ncbi:hypothetical protein ACFQEX_01415 [Roseibium salinum]|uniref:hypothetical protein n=1 Tax=Roseibium salinum TaxID=1604349 RepID=UPI003621C8C6
MPAGSTSVPVVRDEEGGVFASSGERYFAGDLYRPRNASGARDDTAGAAAPRLEAVPAGEENRWGLRPAWIVVDGGKGKQLLQAVRLLRGEALFAPDRAEGACAEILRQAEAEARSKSAGLWGDKNAAPIYSTARPEPLKKMTGYYVIAAGRIVSLGKTERTRYLNFGNYWKQTLRSR